jgi:hypothetical protein
MILFVLFMNLRLPLPFVFAGCILIFCFGGNAGILPAVSRGLFGNKFFSINFAIVNVSSVIAAFIPTVIGIMQTQNQTYRQAIYVQLIISVAGCFISAPVKDHVKTASDLS